MSAPILPYGEWPSPITADAIASGTRSFQQVAIDGPDVWWVEVRPDEAGRYVVMRARPKEPPEDMIPKGFSARTLVNSYGGGAMAVAGGRLVFSNFDATAPNRDQRLYRVDPGAAPVPITQARNARYGDGVIDTARELVFCVMEDGDALLHGQAAQRIVAVDLAGKAAPITLAEGADFYGSPRLSPDGRRLCFVRWDYPSMPWDGTELCVVDLAPDGRPGATRKIAGAPAAQIDPALNPVLQDALRYGDEAIMAPAWAPGGLLHFVSDRAEIDGERWLNIHRAGPDGIARVTSKAAEFAAPPWRLGGSSYGFGPGGEILCAFTSGGTWRLSDGARDVDTPFTQIEHLHVGGGFAVFVGASFTRGPAVVRMDLATGGVTDLRLSDPGATDAARACFAAPEAISFGAPGAEAHAFYHAPLNPAAAGPTMEKPPLLIFIHGGPTASASAALSMGVRYFTSRGFAVVDVNYRGGTGFGRGYHQRMYGEWGVSDVADCVAAARFLIDRGDVDPARIASRGGSSGGYTTLALATFTNLLCAAASYYGISDLEMIAKDTDKLEARYAELLIAPYPAEAQIFKARSPLHHADRISCPLILFQGEDDPVVPPKQARVLIDALMARKLPVAWEFYPGESHGFRIKANIVASLEEELSFYGAIMGFTPAGNPRKPLINNLPGARDHQPAGRPDAVRS